MIATIWALTSALLVRDVMPVGEVLGEQSQLCTLHCHAQTVATVGGVNQRAVLVDVHGVAAGYRGVGVRDHYSVAHRDCRDRRPSGLLALALQSVEVVHGVPPGLELEVAVGHLHDEKVAEGDVRREQLARHRVDERADLVGAVVRGGVGGQPFQQGEIDRQREPSLDLGHRRCVAVTLGEPAVPAESPADPCLGAQQGASARSRVGLHVGEQTSADAPVVGAVGRPTAGSVPPRGCRACCPSGSTRRPSGRRRRRRRRRTAPRRPRSASRCRPRGSTARRPGPRPARTRRTRPGSRPCRRRWPGRGGGSPARARRSRWRTGDVRRNRIVRRVGLGSNTCSG